MVLSGIEDNSQKMDDLSLHTQDRIDYASERLEIALDTLDDVQEKQCKKLWTMQFQKIK